MWGWSILCVGLGQLLQRRWKVGLVHLAVAVVFSWTVIVPLAMWIYSPVEAYSWEKGKGSAVIGGHEFNDPTQGDRPTRGNQRAQLPDDET